MTWQEYYDKLTPAQRAEWKEQYDSIEPLVSKLSPVLSPVEYLTDEQCIAEVARISKQFVVLHNLPKVDGIKADVYMRETFELLRQRCVALHWRQINFAQLKLASRAASTRS